MVASSGSSEGPATDAANIPVVDPTKNVLDLVEAGAKAQEQLRQADIRFNKSESSHIRELVKLHATHFKEMSVKEAERIDAIRKVDAEVAARAQAVSATQATVLAAQVQAAAETVRTSQAAATQASQEALTRVVTPLQVSIDDLRRAQYEQQGKTSQVVESRDVKQDQRGVGQLALAAFVAFMSGIALAISIAALVTR